MPGKLAASLCCTLWKVRGDDGTKGVERAVERALFSLFKTPRRAGAVVHTSTREYPQKTRQHRCPRSAEKFYLFISRALCQSEG